MTTPTDSIIVNIIDALQALNATIIAQAPPSNAYPTMIATNNGQPFAMTWPGQGEGWQKGAGYTQGIQTFRVLVYIDPVAQSDIPSHVVDGAILLEQFLQLYTRSSNTSLFNPGAFQATIRSGPDGSHISHGGLVATLSFGGTPWFGFELQVPVRVQFPLL